MSEIFTLKESMKKLKMSRAWFMKKIKEEKINIVKMGGKIFINSDEIERIKKEGVER